MKCSENSFPVFTRDGYDYVHLYMCRCTLLYQSSGCKIWEQHLVSGVRECDTAHILEIFHPKSDSKPSSCLTSFFQYDVLFSYFCKQEHAHWLKTYTFERCAFIWINFRAFRQSLRHEYPWGPENQPFGRLQSTRTYWEGAEESSLDHRYWWRAGFRE